LFLQAGDARHSLDEFKEALQIDGKDAEALLGAGQASFRLADYANARRYLERAVTRGIDWPVTAELLHTAQLVLSKDPLAPRLGGSERIRRLLDDVSSASEELQVCLNKTSDPSSLAVLRPLEEEINANLQTELTVSNLKEDPEGLRSGLNLIYRTEAAEQICGVSGATQQALILIARKNRAAEQ